MFWRLYPRFFLQRLLQLHCNVNSRGRTRMYTCCKEGLFRGGDVGGGTNSLGEVSRLGADAEIGRVPDRCPARPSASSGPGPLFPFLSLLHKCPLPASTPPQHGDRLACDPVALLTLQGTRGRCAVLWTVGALAAGSQGSILIWSATQDSLPFSLGEELTGWVPSGPGPGNWAHI